MGTIRASYDTIVIGGGIVGLLTALRLRQHGQSVLVVEKQKIGNGSTMSNHGMVHSGALYVRQHAHVVDELKEAQAAFTSLLAQAELTCDPAVYLVPREDMKSFRQLLVSANFEFEEQETDSIPELISTMLSDYEAIRLRERVFSSRNILECLLSCCMAEGVHILPQTPITSILVNNQRIGGVTSELGTLIRSGNVVIANGIGTHELLMRFSSRYSNQIQLRLDIMVHLPKTNLRRGIIFAHFDKPVLMPALNGSALGSFYGGTQPKIREDRKYAVDFDKARFLIEMINTYFSDHFVSTQQAKFWMCGKADFIGDDRAEQGFVNPGYKVIDHSELDSIVGLQTIITGKMSLAFHASREVSQIILGKPIDLLVYSERQIPYPENLMTSEPWAESETHLI